MNRRDFLKSLIALGGAVVVPLEALATASETMIDVAWQTAIDSPVTFYVNEWGALSSSATPYAPSTRLELFSIDPIIDRNDLIGLAQDKWDVAYLIEQAMADEEDADPEGDWEDWIEQADDNTVQSLITDANRWLNAVPDEGDWESADLGGYSDRGRALHFFRDEFDENELFDIAVIEGDCPGSSYFAAELRMDIEEANALAIENDIPIRFAPEA